MKHLLIACLTFGLATNPAFARPNSDWTALQHSSSISIGADVQVQTTDGKSYRGQFKAADDDVLAISASNGDERLPRASIREISVAKHGSRWKHALAGLAIGAGVGTAAGGIASAGCKGFCFKGLLVAFGAGVGIVGGAAVGTALPTKGWRVVYRKR